MSGRINFFSRYPAQWADAAQCVRDARKEESFMLDAIEQNPGHDCAHCFACAVEWRAACRAWTRAIMALIDHRPTL